MKAQGCFNKQTVPTVDCVKSGSTIHSLIARTAKHSAGLQTQVGNCVKHTTRVWEEEDDEDDDDDNNNKAKRKSVPLNAIRSYRRFEV